MIPKQLFSTLRQPAARKIAVSEELTTFRFLLEVSFNAELGHSDISSSIRLKEYETCEILGVRRSGGLVRPRQPAKDNPKALKSS